MQGRACPLLQPSLPILTFSSPPQRPPMAMPLSFRIAVVGDIHNDWDLQEDAKALHFLEPDLVLFTGDFGNENVELVRSVAKLDMPKATILGNHDCWNTHQFSESICAMDFCRRKDHVQLQLECLDEEHVGYGRLDFPKLNISIVGGRPFSCGGDRLFRQKLLFARYGVLDMDQSAKRIYKVASETPEGYLIIVLAHNGPTGLGSDINDICGKDWDARGGDHGDPDLAEAISDLKQHKNCCVPLVVFGHMHKNLAYEKGFRKMVAVGDDNTVYLNGAIVPRVKPAAKQQPAVKDDYPFYTHESQGTLRAFTVINFAEGRIDKIAETWISVCGEKVEIEEEVLLYDTGNKQFGVFISDILPET